MASSPSACITEELKLIMETGIPSVQMVSVMECRIPSAFTVFPLRMASRTICLTSSTELGVRTASEGVQYGTVS
jgi:hypothetical protein